ncbi:MAG TPA: hypothetical protein PLB96_14340 [Syntrophales bacterium]|nr:hypothetical protein [Syntrophales bacterium]
MKYSWCVMCVAVMMVLVSLLGCAGLSQQYRASTEGISVNYTVKKEQFPNPNAKIFVSSNDERLDKDVVGDGAKSSAGSRVLGYVAFGVIYAAFPDQPALRDQQDPIRIFKTAMTERLSKNGVYVSEATDNDGLTLDLLVRQFKIDFNFGKWTGEVGYVAKLKKRGEIVCQDNIYEKATAFNLYGFGSGEKALNEAFSKAIDRLDANGCFSKLQK